MSLGLSVLICLLSVGLMAGRIYEILAITDPQTGLLYTQGIALNPLLLVLFVAITVCCGVIIFGAEKKAEPFFSKSSCLLADAAGIAFVAYGIMLVPQSRAAVLMIVGGVAWFLIGTTGIGSKPKDAVITVLLTLFSAGLCMDAIIIDVYSVHYPAFLHKLLAYVSIMVLTVAVLRNVYLPKRLSRMFLYISGFVCFAFCTMLGIAELICLIASGTGFGADTVKYIAFVLTGIYGLDNALSVLPKAEKRKSVYRYGKAQKAGETADIYAEMYSDEKTGVSEPVTEEKVWVKTEDSFSAAKIPFTAETPSVHTAEPPSAHTTETPSAHTAETPSVHTAETPSAQQAYADNTEPAASAAEEKPFLTAAENFFAQTAENPYTQPARAPQKRKTADRKEFSGKKVVFKNTGDTPQKSGKIVYRRPKD